MMLGAKGILPPLIPNCYVLCTLAILKTFVIRSFFFKKWLLTHVFGGSQVQKSSCKQACIGFMTFCPWYHMMLWQNCSTWSYQKLNIPPKVPPRLHTPRTRRERPALMSALGSMAKEAAKSTRK